jgi:hypothetical protein
MKKVKLMLGDNISSLKKLPENSVDSKYSISPEGFIVNDITGKLVIFNKDGKGYMKARLFTPLSNHIDKRKPFRLHRLIAKAFLENYSDELQVNHKDGDKSNNNVNNLEMVTPSENMYHAWNNLDSSARKEKLNNRRDEYGKFK